MNNLPSHYLPLFGPCHSIVHFALSPFLGNTFLYHFAIIFLFLFLNVKLKDGMVVRWWCLYSSRNSQIQFLIHFFLPESLIVFWLIKWFSRCRQLNHVQAIHRSTLLIPKIFIWWVHWRGYRGIEAFAVFLQLFALSINFEIALLAYHW